MASGSWMSTSSNSSGVRAMACSMVRTGRIQNQVIVEMDVMLRASIPPQLFCHALMLHASPGPRFREQRRCPRNRLGKSVHREFGETEAVLEVVHSVGQPADAVH